MCEDWIARGLEACIPGILGSRATLSEYAREPKAIDENRLRLMDKTRTPRQ